MTRRRGQAALEFLSTYGFAFLLILLMIAALSYFGVLSPAKFLPERCLIQSEFRCDDRQLLVGPDVNNNPAANQLNISVLLTNQLGNTITVAAASGSASYAQATLVGCDVTGTGVLANVATVSSGGQFTLVCKLSNAAGFPAKGEKIKVPYTFQYQELGGAYQRTVSGEVAATIQ